MMCRRSLLSEPLSLLGSWCKRRWLHSTLITCTTSPQRRNQIQIQMLSQMLHDQIFTNSDKSTAKNLGLIREHLKKHGLWNKETTTLNDIDLQLPKLYGKNIDDHFRNLALQQVADYKELAMRLVQSSIPPLPPEWSKQKGWTKYHKDGRAEAVSFPDDEALVFDIECLVPEGDFPTMATAVSDKFWYEFRAIHS